MIPGTSWRLEHDLDVLYLGEVPVGRVARSGGKGDKPRWLFNLKGGAAFWHDAKSLEAAKLNLTCALLDWLQRAGLR